MASSEPSPKRRRLDDQQEDETRTTAPQGAKANDHQQDPGTLHSKIPDRKDAFKAMVEYYTEGDLHDDDGTRRSYSNSLPPGSTPTEQLLWEAFIVQVEGGDDQLLEYLQYHKRYQNEIKSLKAKKKKNQESIEVLEDQRSRDQRRMTCLEQRVAELEARIAPQVLTIANPSASSSVSVEPDDGNVAVVSRAAVGALCEALGLNIRKS